MGILNRPLGDPARPMALFTSLRGRERGGRERREREDKGERVRERGKEEKDGCESVYERVGLFALTKRCMKIDLLQATWTNHTHSFVWHRGQAVHVKHRAQCKNVIRFRNSICAASFHFQLSLSVLPQPLQVHRPDTELVREGQVP